jgi:DNA-directed RNA polymerase specialized sigma24 family protein
VLPCSARGGPGGCCGGRLRWAPDVAEWPLLACPDVAEWDVAKWRLTESRRALIIAFHAVHCVRGESYRQYERQCTMKYPSEGDQSTKSGEYPTPELLEEARARAWCHVYEVYGKRLTAYFRTATRVSADLEDLVSDTLAEVCADASDVGALTWDNFIDSARREGAAYAQRRPTGGRCSIDMFASEPEMDIADACAIVELEDWAEELRSRLSGRQQQAIWHYTMMGACAADAAKLLGCRGSLLYGYMFTGE